MGVPILRLLSCFAPRQRAEKLLLLLSRALAPYCMSSPGFPEAPPAPAFRSKRGDRAPYVFAGNGDGEQRV